DDDRLIDVATERGRTLVRDLACELVGIRICYRIDIPYVADPSWAEPGDDQDPSFGRLPSDPALVHQKRAPADDRCERRATAGGLARAAPFDAALGDAVDAARRRRGGRLVPGARPEALRHARAAGID